MKKGKFFIGTLATIIGIGLSIGVSNTLLSSNASSNTTTEKSSLTPTNYTGLLNKELENKLNNNGINDETISSLDQEQLNNLSTCKNVDDLRILTNYYSYNESDQSVTELSKEEFLTASNDTSVNDLTCELNSSNMEETGSPDRQQTDNIGTSTFTTSLAIWPIDKSKNKYSVQAYYMWHKLPENRGYDLLSLEFDSDISLYRNTYSTKEISYYRAYKKYNAGATYKYKDLLVTASSTNNNFHKKTQVEYSPTKGITVKTRKFPSELISSPFKGLDSNAKSVLKREKANTGRLTSVTYVLNATIIAPRNYFEVSALYGHQVKKVDTSFEIEGTLEISATPKIIITGRKTYNYSTIYKTLPSMPVTLSYEK